MNIFLNGSVEELTQQYEELKEALAKIEKEIDFTDYSYDNICIVKSYFALVEYSKYLECRISK